MIAKMRKLHLVSLSYERDGILDCLERTGAVEVKVHSEAEGTLPLSEDCSCLRERLAAAEEALSVLMERAEKYAKTHDVKNFSLPTDLSVSYSEFLSARRRMGEGEALVARINDLLKAQSDCLAEEARISRALAGLEPYTALNEPFADYGDTAHTALFLGLVPASNWRECKNQLDGLPLCAYSAKEGESVLLLLYAHKSVRKDAESVLAAAGFSSCPYKGGRTALSMKEELLSAREKNAAAETDAEHSLFACASQVRELKIYCDVLAFELEKAETAGKMRATERTFLLEAFLPAEREGDVAAALDGCGAAVYYQFSDPAEDEPVPTLAKNNKVVENFETITNMYSPPNAREIDPNAVMSFFYSLFIGFIMADIGYGLMMLLGGGFLYYKNRAKQGGIKSLAGVFAVGGVFTIIWGFLFNSLLGISVLPFTVMPDAQKKMWSLAGIDIPAVLIISLLIGIVQLMAGYWCKMAQCWHRGKFWDGIFEGAVWAVFSIGAGIAVLGIITVTNDAGETVFHEPLLATAGGILAGAMLLVAVLTAGRHEKFLGKLSKGFGSIYGLINYFTDVLSYIRLYGLMLTGAVIAQVVSQYSLQFLTSGSALVVLGAVLMVVGHVFNLAISLLGAYIHTARLQYVEFFGKFYVGEGQLFTPLGSTRKYVRVT